MGAKTAPIIFVVTLFVNSFAINFDYFPVAVGNRWEFESSFGGLIWHITDIIEDSVVLAETTFTSTNFTIPEERRLYLHDKSAVIEDNTGFNIHRHVYYECDSIDWNTPGRRNATLSFSGSVKVPAGEFHNVYSYITTYHMNMNKLAANAPGVGPIWCNVGYERPGVTYGHKLSEYNIQTVPTAYTHTYNEKSGNVPDSAYSITRFREDSAHITFRIVASPEAAFDCISSYNPVTKVARIYLADTTKALSGTKIKTDHTVSIRPFSFEEVSRIKIYFRTIYAPDRNQYQLVYNIMNIPTKVRKRIVPSFRIVEDRNAGWYDIRGRKLDRIKLKTNGNTINAGAAGVIVSDDGAVYLKNK